MLSDDGMEWGGTREQALETLIGYVDQIAGGASRAEFMACVDAISKPSAGHTLLPLVANPPMCKSVSAVATETFASKVWAEMALAFLANPCTCQSDNERHRLTCPVHPQKEGGVDADENV